MVTEVIFFDNGELSSLHPNWNVGTMAFGFASRPEGKAYGSERRLTPVKQEEVSRGKNNGFWGID